MCIPERPQPDNYDSLLEVRTHFCPTPNLTQIPRGHRYNRKPGKSVVDKMRRLVGRIYRKHDLHLCPRYGLYWIRWKSLVENEDNDNIMLLVIELKKQDVGKWWKIDGEIREILEKWELSGAHGVCVRYYLFNENATVDETTHHEPSDDEATGTSTPVLSQSTIAFSSGTQSTTYSTGSLTQAQAGDLNRVAGRADAIWQPWLPDSVRSRSPSPFIFRGSAPPTLNRLSP